ncbi:STAS domain-containing protein [Streptomyces sp. NBC_01198]|uniref:STAS domain-containing protein n=1 Tax=Streptomyces sp. NBC_01198 TaxID=2903769 RepID=UPI002E130897|nr:STAS domain-containing protein [Streptomyces sp. NBC_01198]
MAGTGRRPIPLSPPDAVTVAQARASRDVRVVRHLRSGLVLRLSDADGLTRASVHGEIDFDSADLLERVLSGALLAAPRGLHVDLGSVGFFDCAGLNALLRVCAQAGPGGGELTVTAISAAVARVLDLTQTWLAFPLAAAPEDRAVPSVLPLHRARPA